MDRIRNQLSANHRGLTIMGLINHHARYVPQEVATIIHVWEGLERQFIVNWSQTQTLDFSNPADDTFDFPSLLTESINTNDVFMSRR